MFRNLSRLRSAAKYLSWKRKPRCQESDHGFGEEPRSPRGAEEKFVDPVRKEGTTQVPGSRRVVKEEADEYFVVEVTLDINDAPVDPISRCRSSVTLGAPTTTLCWRTPTPRMSLRSSMSSM